MGNGTDSQSLGIIKSVSLNHQVHRRHLCFLWVAIASHICFHPCGSCTAASVQSRALQLQELRTLPMKVERTHSWQRIQTCNCTCRHKHPGQEWQQSPRDSLEVQKMPFKFTWTGIQNSSYLQNVMILSCRVFHVTLRPSFESLFSQCNFFFT